MRFKDDNLPCGDYVSSASDLTEGDFSCNGRDSLLEDGIDVAALIRIDPEHVILTIVERSGERGEDELREQNILRGRVARLEAQQIDVLLILHRDVGRADVLLRNDELGRSHATGGRR